MQNDSQAVFFPNGIRALIVDNDARFLRSATMMLNSLNFRVVTCESPVSAVKLLIGPLKEADVVFIDAFRAATCGFDFRGIVEPDLCIPVVYFFSFNCNNVAGDVGEALKRTISAATYIIKKPLDIDELATLWRVVQFAKSLLRRGETVLPQWLRRYRAPATVVEARLPSSSTIEHQGREHFDVARAGRGGPMRRLGDSHDGAGASSVRGRGSGGFARSPGIGGQPTRRQEKMPMTEEQESDDDDDDMVPSHQQQNRRGVQALGVQNQQHGRSLFMPFAPPMLNVPRNNPMVSADTAGPSSSNVAAFTGASNTSALLPLPVFQQAPARATPPAPHSVYSPQAPAPVLPSPVYQQQQQQLPAPLYNYSTSANQPQFIPNQQQLQQEEDMFAPQRQQGSWMGRRRETGTGPTMFPFQQPPAVDPFTPMAAGDTIFGASSSTGPADAGAYRNATVAHLQSPNLGAQPVDNLDDVLRAMMMEMDNSAEALMATQELAAMQGTLGNNGNFSNYNAGIGSSSMVTDVNGGNSASFMAPQGPAVPTGNQVELGAPEIYGSLVGSTAMFNGNNGEMEAMFPPVQYDENAMFPMGALLGFDDEVPMHPEGQQVAAAEIAAATNATGIMPNGGGSGGLGPNWNMRAADEGHDMLEEYLMDGDVDGFLLPQDMNNGHQ